MTENGSATQADPRIVSRLETRSEELVNQYWDVITALANRLLNRNWETAKKFHNGEQWTYKAAAIQINGVETAAILKEMGIASECDSSLPPI